MEPVHGLLYGRSMDGVASASFIRIPVVWDARLLISQND